MKKYLKIRLLILILAIVFVVAFVLIKNNKKNDLLIVSEKNISESDRKEDNLPNEDITIIKDGKIENEKYINEFLEKTSKIFEVKEELNLKIRQYSDDKKFDEIEIRYVPGKKNMTEDEDATENVEVVIGENEEESKKDLYGYYEFIKNKDENTAEIFNALNWYIKRTVDENNNVKIIFYSYYDVTEIPCICTYSLESSDYTEKFKLIFSQRKDMGIKKIIDKEESEEYDFNLYTFGGNVSITIEGDMVYTLEDALKEKVIKVEDILEQCKLDRKYGICEIGYYADGGSTEYLYDEYTILKFNSLVGNKDLVIGFRGQIINYFQSQMESWGYYN